MAAAREELVPEPELVPEQAQEPVLAQEPEQVLARVKAPRRLTQTDQTKRCHRHSR
jgi:hypothetical protein